MKDINTKTDLRNNERWQYFLAGWSCGIEDARSLLKMNHAQVTVGMYDMLKNMSEEQEYYSRKTEEVYENLCKLEILSKEEQWKKNDMLVDESD